MSIFDIDSLTPKRNNIHLNKVSTVYNSPKNLKLVKSQSKYSFKKLTLEDIKAHLLKS